MAAWIGLIAPKPQGLKTLKGRLVRAGFEVRILSAGDLAAAASDSEGDCLLLLADLSALKDPAGWIHELRGGAAQNFPPMLLLMEGPQVGRWEPGKGIEDFLVLPGQPGELEARLRLVMGRLNHAPPGTVIRIGELEIDPDRFEVRLAGAPLELTFKEFELVKFLATRPDRVFTRDQLLNQVWGYDFIGGTRTVDVHIRRLRAKLGPRQASLIETVRNVGYKFSGTP